MKEKIGERISSEARRESILAAASVVFGERGYAGATTDQVAQAAGISQPYVVRLFGTKENLFGEVLERALGKLLAAFRVVIEEAGTEQHGGDAEERAETLRRKLGLAYVDLMEDRGILLTMMQGFIIGHEPVIGAKARAGFLDVYRVLRDEAGFDPDEVRLFLANGMLLNTLIALRLPDVFDEDADAAELMRCAFGSKLDVVLDAL